MRDLVAPVDVDGAQRALVLLLHRGEEDAVVGGSPLGVGALLVTRMGVPPAVGTTYKPVSRAQSAERRKPSLVVR
jgi:hypothetical protein